MWDLQQRALSRNLTLFPFNLQKSISIDHKGTVFRYKDNVYIYILQKIKQNYATNIFTL